MGKAAVSVVVGCNEAEIVSDEISYHLNSYFNFEIVDKLFYNTMPPLVLYVDLEQPVNMVVPHVGCLPRNLTILIRLHWRCFKNLRQIIRWHRG